MIGVNFLNHPEAIAQALSILRNGDNFQWYAIFMLVLVIYIYSKEIKNKNWKSIASGLMLYAIHWFVEIINGLVQHFSGHALWTVPTGTSYLLLVGVGIELSLMFSLAGLAQSNLLPDDPHQKIIGLNNRWIIGIINAAAASIIEIFLVTTPTFVWVWEWWGALTVFITVYIPFFVFAAFAYDWEPKKQKKIIGGLWVVDLIMLILFAGILQWI